MSPLQFWRRKFGIKNLPDYPSPMPFHRASQHVVCTVCDGDYWHHPSYPLAPFLVILCNGDLVKL